MAAELEAAVARGAAVEFITDNRQDRRKTAQEPALQKDGADATESQPAPIMHYKNAVRLHDGIPVDSWP